MGLWKSIKDFGSKLIHKIVRPKIDWKKLHIIKPMPLIGPGGRAMDHKPNPNVEPKGKNIPKIDKGLLKASDIVNKGGTPKPPTAHGRGVIPLTKEQREAIMNFGK